MENQLHLSFRLIMGQVKPQLSHQENSLRNEFYVVVFFCFLDLLLKIFNYLGANAECK